MQLVSPTAAAEPPDFERDVAPIFVEHCLDCHQLNKQNGGLNLTTIDGLLKGGESGAALVAGNLEKSLFLQRVTAKEMPPVNAKGVKPLTNLEIDRLSSWVAAGAVWPKDRELGLHEKPVDLAEAKQFWSFRKVERPPVPVVDHAARVANPIDAFIWQRLEAAGISMSERATPRDLLRRVSLDLRGLPPSLEEQQRFLDDSPTMKRELYKKLVEEMLADSAYGERWGRHWLDLVRYADSNGYERDGEKPSVFRYRDYVIRALNADKPYNRFVLEQLAGDELSDATYETLVATGFHALGTWQDEVDPLEAAQYRADELDDMIRTTSQTFLGITLGCARCHQHKFDPLTMVDYYSLAAILAPLKRPNIGRSDRDLPAGSREEVAAEKRRDDLLSQLEKQIQELLKENKDNPLSEREAQIASLRQQKQELRKQQPDLPRVYRCFEDSPTAPATHLLKSGRASNPGPVMQPRVPAVLTESQPLFPPSGSHSTRRRLAFAEWVVNPDNPLTARVIVNRVWQHHFGTGLVATSSDFGHLGARPTHPELLDWLAHWFMHDANWSLKELHRLILHSETYRQRSQWNEQSGQVDPANNFLWRSPYRRLDIETIRDSTLAVSGSLNRTPFGPPVYLPIPDAVIEAHTDKQAAWSKSPPEETNRRTIYAFVKRTLLVPMLETFDFCDTTLSTERRSITCVAPQALTLYNGEFTNRQAERFAERLERDGGSDLAQQITLAYRLALSRKPDEAELTTLQKFIEQEAAQLQREQSLEVNQAQHFALVQLCRAVLNLSEFVYAN